MTEHKTCSFYKVCDYRNAVGGCPDRCLQYKHKDAVIVIRCKECKKRYNPNECPMCLLVYGEQHDFTHDQGYCDRGERKNENESNA